MKRPVPVVCLLSCLIAAQALAGSATWSANPISGDWNTPANWNPATVPNGPGDIATFGASNVTDISVSADTEVSQIIFATDASAYNLSVSPPVSLTLSGTGLTNNSGHPQNFELNASPVAGLAKMSFQGNASAGSGNTITVHGRAVVNGGYGALEFDQKASAGSSTLLALTDPNSRSPAGGTITFFGHSTAGTSTIVGDGFAATIAFFSKSTADHATISVTRAGVLIWENSNAGSASITVNESGYVQLDTYAYAGPTASIVCNEFGSVGVFGKNDVPVQLNGGEIDVGLGGISRQSIGSLSGDGLVFLRKGSTFILGSNNLNTEFAGSIYDDPNFGGGGLSKIGTGSLTLSGPVGISEGTTVTSGLLVVTDAIGSAQISGGTLAGSGTIGALTVGTGTGTEGFLAPGESASNPRTLTVESMLTFKADGIYTYKLNTIKGSADQVFAKRVRIESGAQFNFNAIGTTQLTAGTVFTPISNTSTTRINGVFANLADGSIVTVGANKFQVSYSGGDGNDLTLTVVQ